MWSIGIKSSRAPVKCNIAICLCMLNLIKTIILHIFKCGRERIPLFRTLLIEEISSFPDFHIDIVGKTVLKNYKGDWTGFEQKYTANNNIRSTAV